MKGLLKEITEIEKLQQEFKTLTAIKQKEADITSKKEEGQITQNKEWLLPLLVFWVQVQ